MSKCTDYEIHTEIIKNTEINSLLPDKINEYPYCLNDKSPLIHEHVLVWRGDELLKCEGDKNKCQLPTS